MIPHGKAYVNFMYRLILYSLIASERYTSSVMSPILTDNQRKRLAKWLTDVLFGYIFSWLLPLFVSIIVFVFLVIGFFLMLIYLVR